MTETIAIVIPHYQRKAGVLARTLAAMMCQAGPWRPHILIVDDSSPAPAAAELSGLDPAWLDRIQIIHQPNAGPAAARNTGLAAIETTFDFIALSDCDDVWPAYHLQDAMSALRHGYDFFFGEHVREGRDLTQFARVGINPADHDLLDADRQIFGWKGEFVGIVLRHPLVGLSTVVYRAARFPGMRFNDSVGLADDLLFAVDVASTGAPVAFGARCQAVYGLGDNLSVVQAWRSNKALFSIASIARYHATLARRRGLRPADRRFIENRLHAARRDFAFTALAMMAAGQPVDRPVVWRLLRDQPWVFWYFLLVAVENLFRRTV